MALRRCWRLAGLVPRLVLNSNVRPVASAPGGRGSLSGRVEAQSGCTYVPTRRFSSSPQSTDVSYEQLKQLLAGRKVVLIDVREPWELREYGFITGSINIPLGQVKVAFQLDPEDFEDMYGGAMPQQTDNIVFSCLAGNRSKSALDTALSLGYKDVRHYPGGWNEWVKNEQHK